MIIKAQIYKYRKRICDDELLKIKSIIDDEIERRAINDRKNSYSKY